MLENGREFGADATNCVKRPPAEVKFLVKRISNRYSETRAYCVLESDVCKFDIKICLIFQQDSPYHAKCLKMGRVSLILGKKIEQQQLVV